MDIGIRGEKQRIEEVGDEDEEDEGGIYIPAFEDQLQLSVNLLQD